MYRLLALALVALFSVDAHARRVSLDPQNRVHAGVSYADTAVGLTGGFDSRLTRLVFVDVGGFLSPIALEEDLLADGLTPEEYVFLRHGLYVAPGLRVPHRQPQAFTWDVLGRAGFGAVWSNDVHPDNSLPRDELYQMEIDPALLAGLELLLRKDALGARLGAKGVYFNTYSQEAKDELSILRPVFTAEFVYQW